jgi:hypothetical protein
MPIFHTEDESEEGSSSGNESEDESDEEEEQTMKPVFVRKENRVTIQQQEEKLHSQKTLVEKSIIQKEDRKNQTRVLVAESIRKSEEINDQHLDDADSDAGLPDDTNDVDDELEVNPSLLLFHLNCLNI